MRTLATLKTIMTPRPPTGVPCWWRSGERTVKRLLGGFRRRRREPPTAALDTLRLEAKRGRALVEESREIVVVLDDRDRVLAASRRARESFAGLEEGARVPDALTSGSPLVVPYEIDGRHEALLYVRETGDMAAYEELRAGFTASVSHELRTPLARLLALLESAVLEGADHATLIEQAHTEVRQIGELIDDVLFLSELESGREVVALAPARAFPILREVAVAVAEQAVRAGVTIEIAGAETVELPLRPRMIRVIASNLVENAIRHAGTGTTCTLSLEDAGDNVVLTAADDGVGVAEEDLPRLFERFYRTDRARASRGTGLGLAIVKHVVTSADGTVEASGGPGRGLTIRCVLPAP
jgi:signal transduction histidine kinase